MRSAVDERGSSWRKTSRSCQRGTQLLDAHDRDQRLGQGQAHPAVALGLDDHHGPGLGDGEVRARDRHLRSQELLPQVEPRGLRERPRLVGQVGRGGASDAGHLALEDVADLAPVAVDRRDQDVRRQVAPELDDELREVRLPGGDALARERLVELDLLGGHRLDLDDLVGAGVAHDPGHDRVRLGRVARPVDRAAGGGHVARQPVEQLGQVGDDLVLDRRAGQAQGLPVRALGDRAGPLGADRPRRRRQVRPELVVGERGAGGLRERRRPGEGRGGGHGARVGRGSRHAGASDARISARCMTRIGEPGARQHAAEVHQARRVGRGEHAGAGRLDGRDLVGAHRQRRVRVLRGERPAEPAALVGIGQVHQRQPVDGLEQPPRPVADAQAANRVAGRVEGHRVGEHGADVGDAEDVDEELGQLVDARDDGRDGVHEGRVMRGLGERRVVLADHDRARWRRRDDRVVAREHVGEPPDQRHALRAVAGVEVHLAAARLALGEVDLVPEPAQHPHDRLADVREQDVVEAGDEQRDPHGSGAPGGRGPRLEAPQLRRRADDRAQVLERPRDHPVGAGLDEHVADRRRLDRPRHHGQAAGVGRQLAQQLVAAAAPDDVDRLGRRARRGGPRSRRRRRTRSRGCRGCSARPRRARPAADPRRARRAPRSARACRRAAGATASLGSMTGPPAGSAAAAASSGASDTATPARSQVAHRLLEQPEPHHVAQVADPSVDAHLVREVGEPARARSGSAPRARRRRGPTSRTRRRRTGRPRAGRRRPPRRCRATRRA